MKGLRQTRVVVSASSPLCGKIARIRREEPRVAGALLPSKTKKGCSSRVLSSIDSRKIFLGKPDRGNVERIPGLVDGVLPSSVGGHTKEK